MTTREVATRDGQADVELMEQVLVGGDLSKMSPADRVLYYLKVCRSVGLNPLTKPFAYIVLNGKMTLYALKDCTDQLREIKRVSVVSVTTGVHVDDLYVVHARGSTPDGRIDEEIGVVSLAGLKGEAKANAMMKAHSKAKRRLTLSICGLGWLDETEVDSIPEAKRVNVDYETGEIVDPQPQARPESMPTPPPPEPSKPGKAAESQIRDRRLGEWAKAQGITGTDDPAFPTLEGWLRRYHQCRVSDFQGLSQSRRDRIIAQLEDLGLLGMVSQFDIRDSDTETLEL